MALDLGSLIATLGVDSSQLKRLDSELNAVDRSAANAFGRMGGYASSAMSQMAAVAGVTLGVAGAFYAVEKSVRFAIDAQEEFRLKTIMIGTGLTNIAKEGQGSFEKMFQQNFRFAQQMYEEIRKEDAKRFASADDLMTAYNAMVQKGYAVRLDEVDALGVLTDKIKLATAGQNTQMQIQQEIRALMDGQMRAGSLLGMELANRLGPGWKDLVQQHRQAGDLLQWLASMWPGISAAAKEVENTIEAQSTTLSGNLKSIGRGGMLGIYELTVQVLKDINDHLREHEQEYIVGIARGWATVKWTLDRISETIDKIQSTSKVEVSEKPLKDMTAYEVAAKNFEKAFTVRPGELLSKLGSDIEWFWSGMNKGLKEWAIAGDAMINEGMFGSLDTLRKEWNYFISQSTSEMEKYSKYKSIEWVIETNIDIIKRDIQNIADFLSKKITWVIDTVFPNLPSWLAYGGTKTPTMEPPAPKLTYPDKSLDETKRQAELRAKGMVEVMSKTFGKYSVPYWAVPEAMGGPPMGQTVATKPPNVEKGSKGADAEANRLMSLFDTLTKDIARLSEGRMSEIDANLERTINQIYKKVEHVVTSEAELEVLARKRAALQKEEVERKFLEWYSKETGDNYAEIDRQMKEHWKNSSKTAEDAAKVQEIWNKKYQIENINRQTESLNLNKQFIDQMSQMVPDLEQQYGLRRRSLELENELAVLNIKKLVEEKGYLKHKEDELILQQALVNQAKLFNLEMEKNKGFSGWAWGRAKEADQRNTVKDMMGGLESGFQNAFSSGLQGVLNKDQNTLKDIGKTMFQGLLGEITKASMTRMFDNLARMTRPGMTRSSVGALGGARMGMPGLSTPQSGTGLSDGVMNGLDQAGQSLQGAASGFAENSSQFAANAAQFGLSAGGLLLSGIGIATNSQALVIAGTALQLVGMVIQVAQTLAAGALTGSAGSLGMAATMLMAAAAVPFFHTGGMVAHGGWLVAHNGLALDERRVIAKVGEGIIKAPTMDMYRRMGVSFDDLNEGRLPAVMVGNQGDQGKSDRRAEGNTFNFNFPNVRQLDRVTVEREVIPVINKVLKKSGQQTIGNG